MRWKCRGWLGVILVTTACGGRAPNNASASPAIASPTAPTSMPVVFNHHLYGVVADGDDRSPVAGASVAALNSSLRPATTDGNGYYDLEVLGAAGTYPGNELTITKPGYDGTHGWIEGNQDQRHDFRLYRPFTISAGSSANVALSSDNSSCGLDDEFQCRLVYVAVPSSGTLVLDTSSGDSGGPYWLVIGNVQYPFHGVTHVEIPVASGSTVGAQVMHDWTAPAGSTLLRTTLSTP
jgi:Carboxypeptidase regulatory-like domain